MKLKLDHINLTVSHLAESVDWYQKVFGFKLVQNGVYSEIKIRWAIVAHSDFMICMHEIKKRKRADTNDQKDFHKVNHFGIRISNLKNWQEKIKRHNLNPFM